MTNGKETLTTASVPNPGKYYNGADDAKMEFLLVCQQELSHDAHDGFVSASAFARFVYHYCEESPLTGPNCLKKHNEFSALPVEIQLAFVDRLCQSDQAEKLECLNRLNKEEEEEEAYVSEWELFGVCFKTFNQLVPAGLLTADLNGSDPDSAYTDDHDEEVESSHPDEQNIAGSRTKSKRKKEKSKKAMKTSAPTISSSPSSSMRPSSAPPTHPVLRPSHSSIPSVSPSPMMLPPGSPTNLIPQQPSLSATPTDPPGTSTSPLPPSQPTSRTLPPRPTQLPNRTESPWLISSIPPEQSLESQSQSSSLSAAGVAGITTAALFLPLFLAIALMRYRSNRARYAAVRDINLGESHSILSEDSDFLGGCYAVSPPSRKSADSQFNPPIEEISSLHMHSIDNPVAPATYLGSGQMPLPLDIRLVPLGSGDMPDIPPADDREASFGFVTTTPRDRHSPEFGVSDGIKSDQILLPDETSIDHLSPQRTSDPVRLSFDSSNMESFTID